MKRFNWLLIGFTTMCLAMVLLAGCVSQSEYDVLQAEYDALQAEYESLQATYDALNADHEDASQELAEIREVYPPRYFNNYNELEDWVDEQTPISYTPYNLFDKHLELQENALAEGYIWSVELSREGIVMSHVVAGDSAYGVWLGGYIEWIGWK